MTQTLETPTPTDHGFPSPPMRQRVMVRGYRTFGGAEDAVDALVEDAEISRDRITLVAREPQRKERDSLAIAHVGARAGAVLGGACGLALYFLGITDGASALLPIVAAALVGTIAGAALAFFVRIEPSDALRFNHYDVLVDEEVAGAARDELTRGSG